MKKRPKLNPEFKSIYSLKYFPNKIIKPKSTKGLPWLTKDQIEKIESYLTEDDIMFEFGCGGSTLYFPKLVKYYYSLEHDLSWYKKTKSKINSDNVFMFHAPESYKGDLKPVPRKASIRAKYPYALEFSLKKYFKFRDYINFVDSLDVSYFDKVLIDGRARSFSAFKMLEYTDENSVLFVDNFYDRLEWHNDILKKYEEIDGANSMIVLRKKV